MDGGFDKLTFPNSGAFEFLLGQIPMHPFPPTAPGGMGHTIVRFMHT